MKREGLCNEYFQDKLRPSKADTNGLRADIIFTTEHLGWEAMQKQLVDLQVTHPTGRTEAQRTTPKAAAMDGEAHKRRKYTDYYGEAVVKYHFVPFVLETYGTLGPAGEKLVKDLADIAVPVKEFKNDKGEKVRLDYDGLRAKYIRLQRERLAVTLQRRNAILLRSWALKCAEKPAQFAGSPEAQATHPAPEDSFGDLSDL